MSKPSLLIFCLPRTMSSLIYLALEKSLGHELKPPDVAFRADPNIDIVGEILNRTTLIHPPNEPKQRLVPSFFNGGAEEPSFCLFGPNTGPPHLTRVRADKDTKLSFQGIVDLSNSIMDRFTEGHLIKEVTQPWLIREYLLANPGKYKVMHIKRNLTDVAHRMSERGWWHPVSFSSFDLTKSPEHLLVEGLDNIQRNILEDFPFDAVIHWEDVTNDPDLLWTTVESLGYTPARFDWYRADQQTTRDNQIKNRKSPKWSDLNQIIEPTPEKAKLDPPFDHHFWSDALDFILKHKKVGETVSAPGPFEKALPSGIWKPHGEGFGNWIVVHKGEIDWLHFDLTKRIAAMQPLFANEVFVLFAPKRKDIPAYNGIHSKSLKVECKKILDKHVIFEDRGSLEKTARDQVQAVGLGDGKVLCRILGKHKLIADMRALEITPHLIHDGFWESWVTLAMIRTMSQGGYFVDVGANTGYYTAIFAGTSGNAGKTLAVEPLPEFTETLKANCIMNGAYGHWEVVCAAAGKEPGTAPLWTPPGYLSRSYVAATPNHPQDTFVGDVPRVVLDDLLRDWPRVDLVKIDVEGGVDLVWEGLKETRQRPETVFFVEYFSALAQDRAWLRGVLEEGFDMGYVDDHGNVVPGTPPENIDWVMLVVSRNF